MIYTNLLRTKMIQFVKERGRELNYFIKVDKVKRLLGFVYDCNIHALKPKRCIKLSIF